MNKIRLLLLLSIGLFSCTKKPAKEYQYRTVSEFINYSKDNDWKGMRQMLRYSPSRKDTSALKHYAKLLNEYFGKYGVPDQDKWTIEHDTVGILAARWIVVPIFEGYDSTNRLEHARLKLGFDERGNFAPDSILLSYWVDAHLRSSIKDEIEQ